MTDDVTGSVADAVNEAMADVVDPSLGFDNELAGLLGNKAKVALIVTRLASAELLAAFCQLSDISAACIGANQGAVAVLKNLDGDGPEAAAKDLTTVVSGMAVILAVNRADKLEVAMYVQGEAGQTFRAARAVHLHAALRRGPDARHRNPAINSRPKGSKWWIPLDSTMIRRCRFSPTTLGADVAGAAPASNRRQPNQ